MVKKKTTSNRYEDLKIRVTADIKNANRSLKELERQVDKLGDLADQGEHRQKGFLSTKQVKMYKEILNEIENQYQQHLKRLEALEKSYNNRKSNNPQYQKDIENYKKREQQYRDAQMRGVGSAPDAGGQPNLDDQVYKKSKRVLDHYKKKRDEAYERVSSYDDPGMEAEIEALKSSVNRLAGEKKRGDKESGRINDMHEMNSQLRNLSEGTMQTIGNTGLILSATSLARYIGGGTDNLRLGEYGAANIGQKIGYGEEGNNDADLRKDTVKTGLKNQYNDYETSLVQGYLIRGGQSGNLKNLQKDTQTMQQFGRAYAVSPNELAQNTALLKTMGVVKEGDMQKFANLLAGSISKTKMDGREEEMMRATTSLLTNIGSKMPSLSEKQATNVVGLQTTLGEALPTLKGERGAELLNNMDTSIKNGDNAFDIIMGKGTKYVGQEGMYQLEYQKEEGLSNPKNLQDFFQGVERTGASDVEKAFMAQKIGLSLHDYEALKNTGLIEKFKKGNFEVSDKEQKELRKLGAEDIVKHIQDWDTTQSETTKDNEAKNYQTSEATAKPFERIGKTANELFNDLPVGIRAAGVIGAGIGGGILAKSLLPKGIRALYKKFTGNIGEGGNFKNPFTGAFSKIKDFFSKKGTGGGTGTGSTASGLEDTLTMNPVGDIPKSGFWSKINPKNLWGMATEGAGNVIQGLGNIGTKFTENAGESGLKSVLQKGLGSTLKYGGKFLGKIGSAAPLVGTAIDVGIDRAVNPQNSWGRSLTKGIFGTIGGALGLAGSVAAGIPTGGFGTVATLGLSAGMGAGGSKLGDMLYTGLFGDSDIKKGEESETQKQVQELTNDETSSNTNTTVSTSVNPQVNTMTVSSLNIQDKDFATYLESKNKNQQLNSKNTDVGTGYSTFDMVNPGSKIKNVAKDYTLKITIDGNVKGMTTENQKSVTSSITDFFGNLLSGGTTASNNDSGYDLSSAQKFG